LGIHDQGIRIHNNSEIRYYLQVRKRQCQRRHEGREEEEEEEGLFKADAVNEEDPERDRATQV